MREHFKNENKKGLDTCNKGDIAFLYEPNNNNKIHVRKRNYDTDATIHTYLMEEDI